MDDGFQPQVSRKQTIDQRIAAIHTRLQELRQISRAGSGRTASTQLERLEAAHRRAAAAQAGARRALASSALAFRYAAEAHEQVANEHAKVAASGEGDTDAHLRREAFHRAAATADQQRAERAESLLSTTDQIAPTPRPYGRRIGGQTRAPEMPPDGHQEPTIIADGTPLDPT